MKSSRATRRAVSPAARRVPLMSGDPAFGAFAHLGVAAPKPQSTAARHAEFGHLGGRMCLAEAFPAVAESSRASNADRQASAIARRILNAGRS